MLDLNQIEKNLLLDLREMFLYEESCYIIDFSNYDLKENDDIKKIQELVFYLERLEGFGLIRTEEGFYKASDKISFEYMNSATEINFDKISITELGFQWIDVNALNFVEKIRKSSNETIDLFFSNRKGVLIGYIIIFILGLILGIGICLPNKL